MVKIQVKNYWSSINFVFQFELLSPAPRAQEWGITLQVWNHVLLSVSYFYKKYSLIMRSWLYEMIQSHVYVHQAL